MSSESIKKNGLYSFLESQYNESLMGISESIISFASLSNCNHKDIYSDTKYVKISELNPKFKQILKQEFLDEILRLKTELLQKQKVLKK
jgi:hypothetical protein